MKDLERKKVAILATNGFEESELKEPMNALKEAGADVDIVSEEKGKIKSWSNGNWSNAYNVDKTINEVSESDYNALVLPGGVINPDKLRRNEDAIRFVKAFFTQKKPVAAICHGPQILAEADVLRGRKITSFSSIKRDMVNAGAKWEDSEVVVDEGLVTSRKPSDIPAFISKLIEEVYEGKHELQTA
ncbi:type 1 glutamine amidotransferase domain-containing protein [Winogradskyella aurantia]|uniref:Protease n=1 Tax=Winogradskyella aurantia TaxID=1915063 RepID=A0A265UQL2_9FLAO|nr:type 1 glutamine amidotransferase domain-containing protein [Winogradskyella aurantia]OZV67604.1 protease [Winogradskyella aurantia]